MQELVPYIDWQPFLLPGSCTVNFRRSWQDAKVGAEATRLYQDAQALLQQIIGGKMAGTQAVVGFWKATSNGKDSVTVQNNLEGATGRSAAGIPAPANKKAPGQPNISLADFIAPAK